MLVLFETPAGYAIFKLLNEKKLAASDNLYIDFQTPESASKIVKLKHFEKFKDTTEALAATTAAIDGKIPKVLKKVLKNHLDVQEELLVADAKLGSAIKEKFNLQCLSNTPVQELLRCMRCQLDSLISGLPKKEMIAMSLGLAHSLSRYKLKFSPDKVDTMIVQAVSLLDDIDKELNNYCMRSREWYGWHFPELGKIVTDNIAFAKLVKMIGTREHTSQCDLSDILSEELEEQVKEAAEISMGTEISDVDILNIQKLCDEIIKMTTYRTKLYEYLKARMMAMAPNLTILVGDLVGARLISNAGSLINLAKHPASTIQILGAEKALFRALKTKKDTPKYGLIYHAQLIGQSSTKNKGKMSRMLAAKAALATRVDALGEDGSISLGAEHKAKLEYRLRVLEEGNNKRISGTGKAKAKFEKYQGVSEILSYPEAADSTLPSGSKRKRSESEGNNDETPVKQQSSKKRKTKPEVEDESNVNNDNQDTEETPKKKEKKAKKQKLGESIEENIEAEDEEVSGKKKKKNKRKLDQSVQEASELEPEETPKKKASVEGENEGTSEKKKKKKKKKQSESE